MVYLLSSFIRCEMMNFAYLKNGFSRLEPLDADEQELDLFRQRLGSTEAKVVKYINKATSVLHRLNAQNNS